MQGLRQAPNESSTTILNRSTHLWKWRVTLKKYKFIMKYIVYLTTNIINNKIYIGVHDTNNPDIFDGYLGNGVNINIPSSIQNTKTPFTYDIKKYGFNKFKRSTLKIFDKLEDALDLERWLVDQDFINRKDTYNITLGGGMPPINNKEVYQYTLDGNFIRKYDSIREASKDNNLQEASIGRAILYKRTSGKYLWSNIKVDKLNINEYSIYNPKIKIYVYDSGGNYFTSYNSENECCKKLQCNLSNIQRAIKLGIMVHGYYLSDKKYEIYQKPKSERLTGIIHQYDLNGKYIKSYNSIKEAEVYLKTSLRGLNDAIKQSPKHYYKGFLWCRGFKQDYMEPYKTKVRKIGQYTMDNKLVKIFNTLRECRKEFPNVSKVLNGTAKHCHHYKFKYIE